MTGAESLPAWCGPFDVTALGDAIERRLVAIFAEFRLTTKNPDAEPEGEADRVSIYQGSIPPRERDAQDGEVAPQFPLVLVKTPRWRDEAGDGGAQKTTVEVEFAIGVRRLNAEGCRDVTAIAERIRTNLLRDPIIENRARLELPLESEVGESDTFPQWVGLVSARFNIPQPIEETPT